MFTPMFGWFKTTFGLKNNQVLDGSSLVRAQSYKNWMGLRHGRSKNGWISADLNEPNLGSLELQVQTRFPGAIISHQMLSNVEGQVIFLGQVHG